ncbi:MAG: hypothetical protein JNL47_09140 [Bacteroidia bacterium]|nr:hypothetical protein [Bacteroidia bacterium]
MRKPVAFVTAVLPFMLLGNILHAQILLDGNAAGGFESSATFAGNGWASVNHTSNQWYVGATGANSGARGAYISNSGGSGNNYTNTTAQVSHFYRDITFPSTGTAVMTFNWKAYGESLLGNPLDYISVCAVPNTITPVAGSVVGSGLLGNFNLQNSWQNATVVFCGSSGNTIRVVFSWINDASGGSNPAAAIDNIHIVLNAGGIPANDLPCNATFLPINLPMSGNNIGAGNCNEPAAPACGNNWNNAVWYKFIAPASGCVKIKTMLGTLTNTQVAAYSGSCSGLTLISGSNCNDDITPCGVSGYAYRHSMLELSGLTAGNMYHVAVDGYGFETGSFSIIIYDACTAAQLPAIPGQDCELPFQVCTTRVDVPNPGYSGFGNRCDFSSGSNCLLQGEKGAVWYRIAITGSGFLAFDILPNDYTSGCTGGGETDYDFALYKIGGAGATSACGALGVPLRCNYNFLGVTGLYPNGSGNPAYGGSCWDNSYEDTVGVQIGDVFLLCISNWDVTNSGFSLRINPASPVSSVVPPGGTVVWTGSTSTDWFNPENWGGCQIPNCRYNAFIPPNLPRYPYINAAGASVRTITISPGAGLSLSGSFQLMVCNDFVNNGAINFSAGSTVHFEDTAVTAPLNINHNQKLNGYLTGANSLGNVVTSKPVGYYVQALQDFDTKGNFTVNGGSFGGEFRAAGMYQKTAGNFTIDPTSPNPATYQASATLEFTGVNQQYKNSGLLNNVVMNQLPGGSLMLTDHGLALPWMILGTAGVLSLQNGIINTNGSLVEVRNRAFNSVEPGNLNSYINGYLRKFLNQSGGTGTYEFPVGTSIKGYQRLSLEVSSAFPATVNFITANFENLLPANNTALGSECSVTWHQAPASPLDNGFWKLQPAPASAFTAGTFNPVLWNRSFTNAQFGFTVQYNRSGNNIPAQWQLNPPAGSTSCANFPVTAVKRVGMSAATVFGNAGEVYFSTAQGLNPLPVELVYFRGKCLSAMRKVELQWQTASEWNNDFFEIQRSCINEPFKVAGRVNGHGTTSASNHYYFTDDLLSDCNEIYYRLRQVDFDGSTEISSVIKILCSSNETTPSLFPNPFYESSKLFLNGMEGSRLIIQIYHADNAELIFEKVLSESEIVSEMVLKPQYFGNSSGVYLIKIISQKTVYTLKAVKISKQ